MQENFVNLGVIFFLFELHFDFKITMSNLKKQSYIFEIHLY